MRCLKERPAGNRAVNSWSVCEMCLFRLIFPALFLSTHDRLCPPWAFPGMLTYFQPHKYVFIILAHWHQALSVLSAQCIQTGMDWLTKNSLGPIPYPSQHTVDKIIIACILYVCCLFECTVCMYTHTGHLIRYALLVLGWIPFAFRTPIIHSEFIVIFKKTV